MVKNVESNAVKSTVYFGGGYESPEVNLIYVQSEGVLCASVYNEQHEGYSLNGEEVEL